MMGQSALLLISGVSGIGKTSLVMAFRERIEQLRAAYNAISVRAVDIAYRDSEGEISG
jgi:putative protein kinase ArgK-like GTPase of G3E family